MNRAEWLADLLAAIAAGRVGDCDTCGATVVRGESLSGPLELDGAVHECPPTPRGWAAALAVELEACNPDEVVEQAAAFGVIAAEIDEGHRYGWPIYRYVGTRAQLLAWLGDAYDDGSGERPWELLARLDVAPARVHLPSGRYEVPA